MNMNMNNIELRPISDLLGKHFFIPSYQRGYRWTEPQVIALLKDIWDFVEEGSSEIYCLQPIVVKKKGTHQDGTDIYEVIDGQQRLTTIYLILKKLENQLEDSDEKNLGSLQYETRDTQSYLDNINEEQKMDNIDFFHVFHANQHIQKWFRETAKTSRTASTKFAPPFIDDVHVIWYEVTDGSDSIDIFTRLNIGKIPLTNGELIKSLFLRKGNFDIDNKEGVDAMYLKQLQIASEWDKIETTLQDNDFWYFIYNPKNPFKYSTRIEYIFDLMKGRSKEHEERYTFLEFDKDFKLDENLRTDRRPKIDDLWLEIKQYFQTLREWYNRKEWFHLIGFLIASDVTIKEIKALSIDNKGVALRKNEFTAALERRVRNVVEDYNLDELNYQPKYMNKIRTILLLFNVETLNQNIGSQIRFPFNLYKETNNKDGFDVEHIRSKKGEEITTANRKEWVRELLSFYIGIDINEINDEIITNLGNEHNNKEIIETLYELYQEDNIADKAFSDIFNKIADNLNEDENTDIDGLGNLALLNRSINRGYKNIMFPLKRKWLLEEERKGKYIPLCTKNVFMKAYSKKMDSFMYWQNKDAEDYLAAIKTTLKKYLK